VEQSVETPKKAGAAKDNLSETSLHNEEEEDEDMGIDMDEDLDQEDDTST